MNSTRNLWAAGILFAGIIAQPAFAQSVELIAKDGSTTVKGELISIRNDKFVIRTNIGVVTFDRGTVICNGAACPVALSDKTDMTIAAPAELAGIIMPLLAEGFAQSQEGEAQLLSNQGIPIDDPLSGQDLARNDQSDSIEAFNIQLSDANGEPTAKIVVKPAGDDRVFDLLAAGEVSLILSEKSAGDDAVRETRASGGGNLRDFSQERVIAVDGYVVVTHSGNDVQSMSLAQVTDVMSGKIDNWAMLGGTDRAINVYSYEPDTEAFQHINNLILAPYGVTLSPAARGIRSNRELTFALKKDPFGIGIVNFSSVRDTRPIAIENECGMVISPTAFNIKTEEYTLQNRITAYSRQQNNPVVSDFLEFLESPSLDDLVAKSGLISLSINSEGKDAARARLIAAVAGSTSQVSSTLLQNFVLDVMGTTRLSTTFRFAPGSTALDNKARRDLARILRYVEDTRPKRLILAGFADARGDFGQNLSLSTSRARAVRDQLLAADPGGQLTQLQIEVRGYGELGPVACNESLAGRATNRRVEIWAE